MRIARQPTRETRQASKSQRAAIVNAAQPSRRTPQPRWRVKMTGSRVIPCLRYRDATRMIGWLCDAFGFRAQAVYEDGSDGIAHAQLTLGDGMIMLGSLRDDRFSQVQSTPAALGGTVPGRRRCRFDPSKRRCCWGRDRHRDQRRGLWRAGLLLSRPRGPPLERWHL